MGCCCWRPEEEVPNEPEENVMGNSAVSAKDLTDGLKWRNEGKKYYNSRLYTKAVDAYSKALEHDPHTLVNYTNLALALKAENRFYEAISTIDTMVRSNSYELDSEAILIKGKIIRARCQTILVKNFCISPDDLRVEKSESLEQAREHIDEALKSLGEVVSKTGSERLTEGMNTFEFLRNSQRVKQYLTFSRQKNSKNKELLAYVAGRLQDPKARAGKHYEATTRFFNGPSQILQALEYWSQKAAVENLADRNEAQHIFDPITYEQFKNPILLQSGLTYEEVPLRMHYEKNGSHDPITREYLGNQLGVANRTLSAYIRETRSPVNRDDLMFANY